MKRERQAFSPKKTEARLALADHAAGERPRMHADADMDWLTVRRCQHLDAAEHRAAKRQHFRRVVGVVAAEAVGREQPARHH
eukprot:162237-Chlamydomonas_euryale.AAC.1